MTSLASATVSADVTSTVTPNTPKSGSTVQINGSAFGTSSSSLPTSITVQLQKGFTTSVNAAGTADSVSTLCTASEESGNTCPAASQVGQGSATATISPSILGLSSVPINLTFFLGPPRQSGCQATAVVVFKPSGTGLAAEIPEESTIGDVCKQGGGVSVSFANLPTYSSDLPSGYTATLSNISLTLDSKTNSKVKVTKKVKRKVKQKNGKTITKTVKKTTTVTVTNHLLNNPATCPATNKWTGTFTIAFGSAGNTVLPLTFACKK
jgi:hypothetical protein